MNVLFVSAVLPYPLYSGGQVRIYNILKKLSTKHSITLVSFVRSEREREYLKNLRFLHETKIFFRGKRLQPRYLAGFVFGKSLLLSSYEHRLMYEYIQRETRDKRFDLVHIEPFYVMPSVPALNTPLVISEHNIEYEVYESYAKKFGLLCVRPVLHIEAKRIQRAEIQALQRASHIIAVSKSDQKHIMSISPKIPVTVVPNGVDTSFFTYQPKSMINVNAPVFLFIGNMFWLPNREALETLTMHMWPYMKRAMPGARLRIVGKGLHNKVVTDSDVTFEGDVRDIRGAYASSDIMLAPLSIAGGSKFKILEAMASGTPVISTSEGISGLDVVSGTHVRVAKTSEEFVNHSLSLIKNPGALREMTASARTLVERKYDWEKIAHLQQKVWESVL